MTIVYRANEIQGLSNDTKPTLVPTNSSFFETDTLRTYNFDGTVWVLSGIGGSVSNAELDGSIALTKIASGTAGKIIGFNSSTGAIEEQASPEGAFVGTGTAIAALTPTAGKSVFCTTTGSGFIADTQYVRNSANTTWTKIGSDFVFGGGSDGDLNVTSGTTTLTETKYYNNVTVAVGATLTANNPMMIFASGTVTVNGTINMDGKGSAAGVDGTLGISGGNGGAGQGNGGSGGGGGAGNGAGQNTGLTGGGPAPGVGTGAAGTLNRVFYNPYDWVSTTPRPSGIGAGGGAGGGSGSGGNGGKGGGGPSWPGGGGPGGTGGTSLGVGGSGGAGGGHLCLFAKKIIVNAGGSITSNGINGSAGGNNPGSGLNGSPGTNGTSTNQVAYSNAGGGGGGGASANGGSGGGGGTGGLVYLIYETYVNNGNVSANGGSGGAGGSGSGGAHGLGGAYGPNVSIYAGQPGQNGQAAQNSPGPVGVPGINGSAGANGILITRAV